MVSSMRLEMLELRSDCQSEIMANNLLVAALFGAATVSPKQQQAVAALLARRGRSKEAMQLLEPMLLESPTSPDLLQLRGECLAAVGNNVGVCLACCFS